MVMVMSWAQSPPLLSIARSFQQHSGLPSTGSSWEIILAVMIDNGNEDEDGTDNNDGGLAII